MFGKISGAEVKNYGIGRTHIAKQRRKSVKERWDRGFISRVNAMEEDADVAVVFGGTNNFVHGDSTIGVMASRDEYTFYGALHTLCINLVRKYPHAEIVFITPLHRISGNDEINEIGLKHEVPLSGYVAIIKEVAGYYGLPVLNLFNASGIQPGIDIIREIYMPDGLHPSDAGAKK